MQVPVAFCIERYEQRKVCRPIHLSGLWRYLEVLAVSKNVVRDCLMRPEVFRFGKGRQEFSRNCC